MGTRVSVELWHAEASVAADCSQRVFAEMDRINALMSSYLESSELSYINDNAAIAAVEISDELALLVENHSIFRRSRKAHSISPTPASAMPTITASVSNPAINR